MDFSCSKPRTGFLMQTNNHQIVDYDLVLDQKFGKEGTPERIKAEEDAPLFLFRADTARCTQGSESNADRIGKTHQLHQVLYL